MGVGGRSLIVVGASAGGVQALTRLVGGLPADLPATVVVVLHVPSTGSSVLSAILDRHGELPATPASQGARLLPGRIYVAPPDHHVLVGDGELLLDRGPKHNGHRPAIDPLFESAAHALGAGVIGVILSGTRDDGTAGLGEIKRRGGLAVVQDPDDAAYPSMPENALERVDVDHVVDLEGMGALLTSLVSDPRDPDPGPGAGMVENGPDVAIGS